MTASMNSKNRCGASIENLPSSDHSRSPPLVVCYLKCAPLIVVICLFNVICFGARGEAYAFKQLHQGTAGEDPFPICDGRPSEFINFAFFIAT
jgi:hypothetical protein